MNNNKILVNLVVPTLKQTFNVFLPINKTVAEIIIILNQTIHDLTDGSFPISNNLSLINCATKEELNYDYSIKICKVEYGSTLALI